MENTITQYPLQSSMTLLSRLLLALPDDDTSYTSAMEELRLDVRKINRAQFDDMLALANSNHVVVRAMETLLTMFRQVGGDLRIEWAVNALATERARVSNALDYLEDICTALDGEGLNVAVIKSLDHWPDLGSDIDLYTDAHPEDVMRFLRRRFDARIAPRSWGDRLAGKWNFLIPGLPEAVEIHMGRLGQTGEQVNMASRILKRSRQVQIGSQTFRVASVSDRLMISTLQRMYRHFYFRLCDIVDTVELTEKVGIDFSDLSSAAMDADIWQGVATYLAIVSDYAKKYRGIGLVLPQFVRSAARFGGDELYYAKEFLRVPIMPKSVELYSMQLGSLLRKRELQSGARLSLLPWLATAAVVGQKMTGSDKGIW
jgi:hypothetical protein